MAAIDTSLLPSGNVRFQMAAMPEPTDPLAEEQKRLANQVTAQNLSTAKRNAQKQQLTDAMRDVMTHETPEDAIASIDRHVADGTLTAEQAADAKSKVPVRGADGSLPQGAMAAWRQRNFDDYIATNEQLYESQTRRQQQQQMQDIMGMGAAPAPAAPTNALAPTPTVAAPTSQPAAPAAAPTNALVSPPAQGVDVNALRRQITQLNMLGTPSALAQARFLETQIPEPVKAPTETDLAKLIREQKDYKPNSPEWKAYQNKINELSGGMTQYQQQSLQLERDKLKLLQDKANKGDTTADAGKELLTSQVISLRDTYDALSEKGGIVDTKAPWYKNLGAWVSSTGPGQTVGKALGTDTQSLRNTIAQSRPLLLNAIKQATGMTAKQMDSNVELQMYLKAATDPTADIQSNRKALQKLNDLFGLGIDLGPIESSATPAPAAGTTQTKVSGKGTKDDPIKLD